MKTFIDLVIKFRWYIVLLIPIISLSMALQLKNLAFEGSYRIWFAEDSSIIKNYDNFRSIFGNDESLTISFKNEKGIFNKESLAVIQRITQKLWETQHIARVDSLTNFQYIHKSKDDPDDVIVEDFISDISSLDEESLKVKEQIILREDSIINRIISKDLKTTTIVARLTPNAGDDPQVSLLLNQIAKDIVQSEKKYGYEFILNGGPIVNSSFIEIAQADGALFTPLVLLITMILLLIIFKKFSTMFISISIVIFTFLIVLSVQVILGYKLNNFTVNMPVFVTAIGIADAMHIFWIYTLAKKRGDENIEAIHYTMKKNFLPIFFTSITTAVGFASLAISDVIPIKTLGIATANAALLAFVLTMLFIPAILAIINPKIKVLKEDEHKSKIFSEFYAKFIIKHAKKILVLTSFLFFVLAYGISYVKVDSNTVRYFKEDVPWRKAVNFLQDNIAGPMSYEIVVDSQKNDGIKDPKFLRTLEDFYKDFYSAFPNEVRHISSLLEVIKKFNQVMNDSKTVPNSSNLVAQYLLLYSLSLPQGMEINDQMDINERLLRVTVSMNVSDTTQDIKMINYAQDWWKNTEYSAQANGQTVMFAYMQTDVTETLINSITIAIIAVSIMMLLIFRNIRLLPLFIIPNILPIILVIGVMGWLSIYIDIGVAIAGAIIIGVAVDDTIHFFVKYLEARKKGLNMHDSLSYVMLYAGNAIILTTVILSLSFCIFLLSDFLPNYMFGLVTASALIIAVITDLLLLPAILVLLDSRKNK